MYLSHRTKLRARKAGAPRPGTMYGPRRPQDSPGRACAAVAHSLSRRRPHSGYILPHGVPRLKSCPRPAPPLRRQLWRQLWRQLRRQLWRQPSYGFSLMPISCLAVAFSMRSRLPPIMVPCIACGAHAVHVQSPYHLLSTYHCRLFTTHCLITQLPLTSRYLHRRVSLLGRGEGDEPEALAHLVKGWG